jgi:hypothetical protein
MLLIQFIFHFSAIILLMRGKINVIAIIHFKKLLIYFLKNKLIFSILNTYETHFFNRKI